MSSIEFSTKGASLIELMVTLNMLVMVAFPSSAVIAIFTPSFE